MAIRTPRRSEWHQVNGKWTRSLGHRGMRVRLFQIRRGGMFFRAVWVAGAGRSIVSLGTRDRSKAEQLGKRLLAALLEGEAPRANEAVRLADAWRRFQLECATFLDNAPSTRADSSRRAEVLLAFFGPHRDVRTLTAHDVAQYSAARRRGGIKLPQDPRHVTGSAAIRAGGSGAASRDAPLGSNRADAVRPLAREEST